MNKNTDPTDKKWQTVRGLYATDNAGNRYEVPWRRLVDSDEGPHRCESGWTGDRCTFPLFHGGPHSNEGVSR